MQGGQEISAGVLVVYRSAFGVKSFHMCSHYSTVLGDFTSYPPTLFYGKYEVSIIVPLFSVWRCHSQRCDGYPTRSARVLVSPPSFQAPSQTHLSHEFKLHCTCIQQTYQSLVHFSGSHIIYKNITRWCTKCYWISICICRLSWGLLFLFSLSCLLKNGVQKQCLNWKILNIRLMIVQKTFFGGEGERDVINPGILRYLIHVL